jgi:signal transduction histidine kinase
VRSAARNSGETRPDVAAVYFTLLSVIAAIVTAMWVLRWFVYPAVPAARYTVLAAIVAVPTVLVARWRGQVPWWAVTSSFAAYVVAVTIGIHFGGGVDNVSGPLLYALVICLAGLMVSARAAYAVAAGSLVLYALMVAAERNGVLAHHLSYTKGTDDAVATVIAVGVYLLLVASVVSYTAREIHQTHRRVEALRAEAVSALSHDLKNPLGVVENAAELAEEGPPEDLAEHLRSVKRAARQALDLVNNVLDAAALDAQLLIPARAPVDLNRLAAEVCDLYQASAAAKSITLTTLLPPNPPVIDADARLLARALGNLVSNALKFTEAGGRVEIGTARSADRVTLTVRDSGRGIPPGELELLFEKYRRASTAGRQGGTGLGLYIVRSIAEAHGGTIRAESAPSAGTVFILELPLAPPRGWRA